MTINFSIKKSIILLVLLPIFISGCFMASVPLARDIEPSPKKAYIYGKFLHKNFALTGNGTPNQIGINVTETTDTGKSYVFAVEQPDRSVYPIEVTPGKYKISEFVFGSNDRTKKLDDTYLSNTFEAKSGIAYYLGDFTATGSVTNDGRIITTRWEFSDIEQKFRSTTSELDKKYPLLKPIQKVFVFEKESDIEILEKSETIQAGFGILYGDFDLDALGVSDVHKMYFALRLVDSTGKIYNLPFSTSTGIVAVPLPAGKYKIEKIVTGDVAKDIDSPNQNYLSFTVTENQATYIGHHTFEIRNSSNNGTTRLRGGYKGAVDNFSIDKDLATIAYKQLGMMVHTNAHIAPTQ